MIFSDYLAITALILSLVSILVAFKTACFGQRVDLAEKKASVMIIIAEATNNLFELSDYFQSAQKKAEELEDEKMYKEFNTQRIVALHQNMDQAKNQLKKLPKDRALDLYESLYHEFHALNQQIISLDKYSRQRYKDNLERINSENNA